MLRNVSQHRLVFVPFMFWLNEPLLLVNTADPHVGSAYRFRNSSIAVAHWSMRRGSRARRGRTPSKQIKYLGARHDRTHFPSHWRNPSGRHHACRGARRGAEHPGGVAVARLAQRGEEDVEIVLEQLAIASDAGAKPQSM